MRLQLIVSLMSLVFALRASAEGVETFVYKRVGELDIKLDVHRSPDEGMQPIVVWIHGGALINGGREGVSGRVKKIAADAGCLLVSIDYRLAPETKVPEIVEDLEDAFRWIRKNGKEKFNADTKRIVVMGGSAGGYLTLTAGFRVDPPPTALVSFWGYGDLVGPWLREPSPHQRHEVEAMTKEEVARIVGGPPIANSKDRESDGGRFYRHCRREGLWPLLVAGYDPELETEKFVPLMASRNVSAAYPPTLMVHGTADTDVPFLQSKIMAAELEAHGVEHILLPIDGGEHGLLGGDPDEIERAYAEVDSFLRRQLSSPQGRQPR